MIKVLIADDNADHREIVRFFLERRHVHVAECEDGREAVAYVQKNDVDCVVLDLLMPIQDGFTTLAEIRAEERLADLPILVLTSIAREASVVRAFQLGATDYLRKPFSPEELYLRILRLLPPAKRQLMDLD